MVHNAVALRNPSTARKRNTQWKYPFCARTSNALFNIQDDVYDVYLTEPAGFVGVIDQIVITTGMASAAGVDENKKLTISVDGVNDVIFNLTSENGTTAAFTGQNITIPVNGGIIVAPGNTIRVRSSGQVNNTFANVAFYGHHMRIAEAAQLGIYQGQWVSGQDSMGNFFIGTPGNLVNGVRTTLIAAAAAAGKCIEIMGMWFTGSTLTSAVESLLIEATDGATHRKVARAFNAFGATNLVNMFRVNHGSGNMRVRLPVGYGLAATAVGAGAAAGNLHCAIWGRYVPAQETYEGTGVPNQAATASKYFWYYDETTTANSATALFPATQSPACDLVVEGWMTSGIGGGTSGSTLCYADNVHPIVPSLSFGNAVSAALVVDDVAIPVQSGDILSTGRIGVNAPLGLAHTVWGRIISRDGHYSDDTQVFTGA